MELCLQHTCTSAVAAGPPPAPCSLVRRRQRSERQRKRTKKTGSSRGKEESGRGSGTQSDGGIRRATGVNHSLLIVISGIVPRTHMHIGSCSRTSSCTLLLDPQEAEKRTTEERTTKNEKQPRQRKEQQRKQNAKAWRTPEINRCKSLLADCVLWNCAYNTHAHRQLQPDLLLHPVPWSAGGREAKGRGSGQEKTRSSRGKEKSGR